METYHLKNLNVIFSISNKMSFDHGTHCLKIGELVHIKDSLCRAFLIIYKLIS